MHCRSGLQALSAAQAAASRRPSRWAARARARRRAPDDKRRPLPEERLGREEPALAAGVRAELAHELLRARVDARVFNDCSSLFHLIPLPQLLNINSACFALMGTASFSSLADATYPRGPPWATFRPAVNSPGPCRACGPVLWLAWAGLCSAKPYLPPARGRPVCKQSTFWCKLHARSFAARTRGQLCCAGPGTGRAQDLPTQDTWRAWAWRHRARLHFGRAGAGLGQPACRVGRVGVHAPDEHLRSPRACVWPGRRHPALAERPAS